MMTRDEERVLIQNFQAHQCQQSAATLIQENDGFIRKVVNRMSGYGIMADDMLQQAYVGYITAMTRFDASFECKLNTYARHYIMAELNEYVIDNTRIGRLARNKVDRKLFFNLRRIQSENEHLSRHEINKLVASTLAVSLPDVERMEMKLNGHNVSYNTVEGAFDSDGLHVNNFLVIESPDGDILQALIDTQASENSKPMINEALASLNDKKRDVFIGRFLCEKKVPLKTLALKHNVSKQRVEQIQKEAFISVKTHVMACV